MKKILEIRECEETLLEVKKRKAARAIMFKNNKLVMIQSKKFKEYKFAGGGVKEGEVLKETLIREVLEETGFDVVKDSIKEFGKVEEIHIDAFDNTKLFRNISYYFLCEFEENGKNRNMDNYEVEYGYEVKLVDIDDAIIQNLKVVNDGPTWVKREIEVLKYIKKNYINKKEYKTK